MLAFGVASGAVGGPAAGLGEGVARADVRIDGLSAEPPAKVLIFIVRGPGVPTPFISFQERARGVVEEHMHVRVISMDETLAAGGAAFQKQLAACRGDPRCLSKLVGAVDAKYLLVITATLVERAQILGSRLVDLAGPAVLGEAADEVPADRTFLDAIPDRIQASVPAAMWDPFGALSISVEPAGAQVAINGLVVGMAPMRALGFLTPGEYKVEATKDGFVAASALARVDRGDQADVTLHLAELPHEAGSRWWVWAGAGLVAVAGAATAFAVLHGSSKTDPTFCSAVSRSSCP